MSAEIPSEPFFDCVQRLGWLKADQLARLRREIAESGEPPLQGAVRLGYLESTRLDVVRMLLDQGEPLPGYQVLDVLGIGGMGVVYRARQKTLDRIVAVKTIQLKSIDSPTSLERFEQEARALAKLQHVNIVSAIDFGRHDGRVYLVMEFVNGLDLQTCLKRNLLFSERRVWKLVRQAAVGLAHAGRLGIVHRDIKPGNLMLVEQGSAAAPEDDLLKIADFGLARLTDDSAASRITTDGMAVGTPPYMAPEQLQGDDIDFRADIYALGATAYHLLSHEVPFAGLIISQIVARKLQQGPKPLTDVAPALRPASVQLVEDMMRIDPAERPTYAQLIKRIDEMIPSLAETAAHTFSFADTMLVGRGDGETPAVTAAQEHPTIPTLPLIRRRPRLVWGLIAGGLAAALLLVLNPLWRSRTSLPLPPVRGTYAAAGPPLLLVRPQSLEGWQIVNGSWIASLEEPVLVGTSGILRRPLLKSPGSAVEFFRFEGVVNPLQSQAAELQFGIEREGRQGRYACRVAGGRAELGRRFTDQGKFEPLTPPVVRELTAVGPQTLCVERQAGGWFVDVNDAPLGALPHQPTRELPEIRLAVEQGPAQFYDIELTELRSGE